MDLDILRAVSILRDLDEAELSSISKLFTVRQVKPGERILEEGTQVKAFCIVCDGVVHVRRLAQKREMLLGRIGAGGFFGEVNLFDPGVATASIYAMKQVTIAAVDYDSLRQFMSSAPETGYKMVSAMMAELARRLRLMSGRFVNAVYWSSEQMAAPDRSGSGAPRGAEFGITPSQT